MGARIFGTLRNPDGSKAKNCKITFSAAGMKDCFTDADGHYEIDMPSGHVNGAYVAGHCIWEGYLDGGRLDLSCRNW